MFFVCFVTISVSMPRIISFLLMCALLRSAVDRLPSVRRSSGVDWIRWADRWPDQSAGLQMVDNYVNQFDI